MDFSLTFVEEYIYVLMMNSSPISSVLAGRGGLSYFCWVWSGRGIDLFSGFGSLLPSRGVDLCLSENFLSIFFKLAGRGSFSENFVNDYPN